MSGAAGRSAEIEEALIIPRLVKLLVFRNSADCFCETIPLQGKLSCLVNMLDDTRHGFGLQIGALVPPQLTAPLGFTDCNFASTRFANACVTHTALAAAGARLKIAPLLVFRKQRWLLPRNDPFQH